MRPVVAGLTGSLLPGLGVSVGLPWPAACLLALLGVLATTGPAVLREVHLHQEVMAAVDKAGGRNDLDVTQVITLIRSDSATPQGPPARSRRRTRGK